MTTIEIFETGHKAEIPASWGEMSPWQIRKVFRIFDDILKAGGSPLGFNIRVLYLFLGLKPKGNTVAASKLTGLPFSKRDENIYLLCEKCLGFMFEKGSNHLIYDSVVNPLPWVRVGLTRLIGPADLLADLTFGEFRHASATLASFFKSGDVADMNECIAFLYRRRSSQENKAGRKVIPMTGGNAAKNITLASRLKPWQKNLIMMWFAACLKYLQEGDIVIDGETVRMKTLFSGGGNGPGNGPGFGWSDLLIEVAKQQSLGTMEQVEDAPLYNIFAIMWHNYKENKRYEKASKTRKRR